MNLSPNKLIAPQSPKKSKFIDQEELGRNLDGRMDWIENYEIYDKISDCIPRSQKTDKVFKILRRCIETNQDHYDREFPHNKKPLIDPTRKLYYKNWEDFSWASARDVFKHQPFYVFNGISPQDIKQQAVADCYLLGPLACLATQPGLVRRLFDIEEPNEYGVYSVWLNINGFWKEIVIDDYFPVNRNGHLAFATPTQRQQEVWVMLVEKAYAKAYGGYFKIGLGRAGEAFRDLTGAPSVGYELEDARSSSQKREVFWNKLVSAFKNRYLISASSIHTGGGVEQLQENGIMTDHVYSILDVQELTDARGRAARIVQLRNPWARIEWNGDWSDRSPLWTPALRRKFLAFEEDDKDGLFWMDYFEFVKNFEVLYINKVEPTFTYNAIRVPLPGKGNSFRRLIKVCVRSPGKYTFSVDKKDIHTTLVTGEVIAISRIIVARLDKGDIKFVKAETNPYRNTHIRAKLEPGMYIVVVELMYPKEIVRKFDRSTDPMCERWRDAVFSTYGPSTCALHLFTFEELKTLPMNAAAYVTYRAWRDFFRNPPRKSYKYFKTEPEIKKGVADVQMKDGKVVEIEYHKISCVGLFFYIFKNKLSRNLEFDLKIKVSDGYELICRDGSCFVTTKLLGRISIPAGGLDVMVMRPIADKAKHSSNFIKGRYYSEDVRQSEYAKRVVKFLMKAKVELEVAEVEINPDKRRARPKRERTLIKGHRNYRKRGDPSDLTMRKKYHGMTDSELILRRGTSETRRRYKNRVMEESMRRPVPRYKFDNYDFQQIVDSREPDFRERDNGLIHSFFPVAGATYPVSSFPLSVNSIKRNGAGNDSQEAPLATYTDSYISQAENNLPENDESNYIATVSQEEKIQSKKPSKSTNLNTNKNSKVKANKESLQSMTPMSINLNIEATSIITDSGISLKDSNQNITNSMSMMKARVFALEGEVSSPGAKGVNLMKKDVSSPEQLNSFSPSPESVTSQEVKRNNYKENQRDRNGGSRVQNHQPRKTSPINDQRGAGRERRQVTPQRNNTPKNLHSLYKDPSPGGTSWRTQKSNKSQTKLYHLDPKDQRSNRMRGPSPKPFSPSPLRREKSVVEENGQRGISTNKKAPSRVLEDHRKSRNHSRLGIKSRYSEAPYKIKARNQAPETYRKERRGDGRTHSSTRRRTIGGLKPQHPNNQHNSPNNQNRVDRVERQLKYDNSIENSFYDRVPRNQAQQQHPKRVENGSHNGRHTTRHRREDERILSREGSVSHPLTARARTDAKPKIEGTFQSISEMKSQDRLRPRDQASPSIEQSFQTNASEKPSKKADFKEYKVGLPRPPDLDSRLEMGATESEDHVSSVYRDDPSTRTTLNGFNTEKIKKQLIDQETFMGRNAVRNIKAGHNHTNSGVNKSRNTATRRKNSIISQKENLSRKGQLYSGANTTRERGLTSRSRLRNEQKTPPKNSKRVPLQPSKGRHEITRNIPSNHKNHSRREKKTLQRPRIGDENSGRKLNTHQKSNNPSQSMNSPFKLQKAFYPPKDFKYSSPGQDGSGKGWRTDRSSVYAREQSPFTQQIYVDPQPGQIGASSSFYDGGRGTMTSEGRTKNSRYQALERSDAPESSYYPVTANQRHHKRENDKRRNERRRVEIDASSTAMSNNVMYDCPSDIKRRLFDEDPTKIKKEPVYQILQSRNSRTLRSTYRETSTSRVTPQGSARPIGRPNRVNHSIHSRSRSRSYRDVSRSRGRQNPLPSERRVHPVHQREPVRVQRPPRTPRDSDHTKAGEETFYLEKRRVTPSRQHSYRKMDPGQGKEGQNSYHAPRRGNEHVMNGWRAASRSPSKNKKLVEIKGTHEHVTVTRQRRTKG